MRATAGGGTCSTEHVGLQFERGHMVRRACGFANLRGHMLYRACGSANFARAHGTPSISKILRGRMLYRARGSANFARAHGTPSMWLRKLAGAHALQSVWFCECRACSWYAEHGAAQHWLAHMLSIAWVTANFQTHMPSIAFASPPYQHWCGKYMPERMHHMTAMFDEHPAIVNKPTHPPLLPRTHSQLVQDVNAPSLI